MYGDVGRHGGAQSLPALISEVVSESYTARLHVGDFAYDLDSDGGVVSMMSSSCIMLLVTLVDCMVILGLKSRQM